MFQIKSNIKFIGISLFFAFLSKTGISQQFKNDNTPKTYAYFSVDEEWKLRIFSFKNFELLVRNLGQNYFMQVEGKCMLTDSSIQLVCDSSINLNVLLKDTSLGLNVKGFLRGDVFKRVNDYIIPKNSNGYSENNIYGKYFQQVELNMGGTEIEIKTKNKYLLTEYTCKGNFIEKGSYSQVRNCITLEANRKSGGLSSFLMDDKILFINNNFIITRKIQTSTQPERFLKEEVFLYFLRM